MKGTLALLGHGQSSPAEPKTAEAEKHPPDCPCAKCVARHKVETFAAVGEALKAPLPPQEAFYPDDQRPSALPRRPWHGDEEPMSYEGLAEQAALMAMAAQALPKERGRPKKHSRAELLHLLQGVAEIQAEWPEMNDTEALERHSEKQGLSVSLKTLRNQLCEARKLFPHLWRNRGNPEK